MARRLKCLSRGARVDGGWREEGPIDRAMRSVEPHDNNQPLPLHLALTRERVRQIEAGAPGKLGRLRRGLLHECAGLDG